MSNITQKWLELLFVYSTDYSAKFSVSELARKSDIPQQTASRYLDKLSRMNLINYVFEGKNKLFYFELTKPTTRIIFNLVEGCKALEFQTKEKITGVINDILKHCESLIVFGSYASKKYNKESDLDIVIFGKKDNQIKKIKQSQIIEINEHYINYDEFLGLLNEKNPLAIEILKNHIIFGDVSKIVDIFIKYGQK